MNISVRTDGITCSEPLDGFVSITFLISFLELFHVVVGFRCVVNSAKVPVNGLLEDEWPPGRAY